MAGPDKTAATPTEIKQHQRSRVLDVAYGHDTGIYSWNLSYDFGVQKQEMGALSALPRRGRRPPRQEVNCKPRGELCSRCYRFRGMLLGEPTRHDQNHRLRLRKNS